MLSWSVSFCQSVLSQACAGVASLLPMAVGHEMARMRTDRWIVATTSLRGLIRGAANGVTTSHSRQRQLADLVPKTPKTRSERLYRATVRSCQIRLLGRCKKLRLLQEARSDLHRGGPGFVLTCVWDHRHLTSAFSGLVRDRQRSGCRSAPGAKQLLCKWTSGSSRSSGSLVWLDQDGGAGRSSCARARDYF